MTLYRNAPDGECVRCEVGAEECSTNYIAWDGHGGCCADCRHPFWVPVKTTHVYRMVATRTDGKLKRWPFSKEAQAVKHLADLHKDIAERKCYYSAPYLEQREVTEWVPR